MKKNSTNPPASVQLPAGKRATLKTISELTGLSLSTVSLSLRGGEALKEETRQKVAEAARLVGYVPDRAGVRLRTGKTNVIALVLDGATESIDFAGKLIQGMGNAVTGTRYHLTVMPEFARTASVDTIRYILDNRTADGVIITHTGARDRRVQLLMDNDFPFVSHGRTEFFTQHAYHDFHSERFASMAVERLVEKGRRHLALVIGDDSTMNYHNIVTAFERTCAALRVRSAIVGHGGSSAPSQEMRKIGQDLALSPDRPDGVIGDSELRSISMIGGLQDAGLVLGRDIDVISKQTSDILQTVYPGIDTIEEDVHAAGVELTRLLLRRIEGERGEALQTLSEPIPHWRS